MSHQSRLWNVPEADLIHNCPLDLLLLTIIAFLARCYYSVSKFLLADTQTRGRRVILHVFTSGEEKV